MSETAAAPELLGAADRAGSVIRDQIASMTEAAQTTAGEIEREAGASAASHHREAIEQANAALDRIGAIERELGSLKGVLTRESDGLRSKLDRAKIKAGPAGAQVSSGAEASRSALPAGASPRTGAQEVDDPTDEAPDDAREEAEAPDDSEAKSEDSVDNDAREPATSDEGTAGDSEMAGQELPAADPGDEPAAAGESMDAETDAAQDADGERSRVLDSSFDDEPEVDDGESGGGEAAGPELSSTSQEGRDISEQSLSEKSHLELAEFHAMASRRAEEASDPEEADYWSQTLKSVTAHAADRPDLEEKGRAELEQLGRRARRRQARRLEALLRATSDVNGSTEEDLGGAPSA